MHHRFLLCVAWLLGPGTLPAQTLDQAERELQAAKEQQARKDAANRAARAREQAEAARMAGLLIRSDADCRLSVNAEDEGVLVTGTARKLKVPSGDVLIECVSTEDDAVVHSEVRHFDAQQNAVVLLELKVRVATALGEREVKAAADAATAAEAAKRNRFVPAGDGMLKDTRTGLHWTQSDNGWDVDWNAARQYCAGKGWNLPSVDELQAIYDGGVGTSCGTVCKVSHLFQLSSPIGLYWSDTATGENGAWGVALDNGNRGSLMASIGKDRRALCVRRL